MTSDKVAFILTGFVFGVILGLYGSALLFNQEVLWIKDMISTVRSDIRQIERNLRPPRKMDTLSDLKLY